MSSTQHLVVGAGLAGAAVAWQLAERGQDVTLVDRRRPAAPDGSSHGSARIFRYAYPRLSWTRLVLRSLPRWRALEEEHGGPLITATGALDLGTERDPHALAAVLQAAGVDHELVTREQARRRWPQIEADTDVLYHPGAGVIDAETAVHAMVSAAEQHGARVVTDWPLASVRRTGSGFTAVAADGRTESAGSIVVAVGGWLPGLLDALSLPPAFLAAFPPLEVRQENAFHFPYRDHVADGPSWPSLIHKRTDIQVYALPGGRDADHRGQKVAEYNGGRRLSSASAQHDGVDPVNRERVVSYVRQHLPGLVPEPYGETTCLFTNTPTEDFVVDGVDGVTVVSPCSGHGAKFAPLIGELGADCATGRRESGAPFRVGSASHG